MRVKKRLVPTIAEEWFPGRNLPGVEEIELNGREFGRISLLGGGVIMVNEGDFVIKVGETYSEVCPSKLFWEIYERF